MTTRTLTFIPSSDIVNHFVPQQNIDQFYTNCGNQWPMGYTKHSLVDSNEFLYTLLAFLQWLKIGADAEKVENEYWEMVGQDTFIDLEA